MKKSFKALEPSQVVCAGAKTIISLMIIEILLCPSIASSQNTFSDSPSPNGFVENKGQIMDQNGKVNSKVLYLYSSRELTIQLRKNGFSYDIWTKKETSHDTPEFLPAFMHTRTPKKIEEHCQRIDIDLEGANLNSEIIPINQFNDYLNYFSDGGIEKEITHIHRYEKIVYKNIYPFIDMEFITSNKNETTGLKYNLIVHPGGDVNQIKLSYKGARMKLEENQLSFQNIEGQLSENVPESYFISNGKLTEITVKYKKLGENLFGFSLPEELPGIDFNNSDLIIDPHPSRLWGTYFGGPSEDIAYATKVDASGNIYICGITYSSSNIATSGAFQNTLGGSEDAFIAKFDSTGAQLWATYYGGSEDDIANALTIDDGGNIYICGQTASANVMSTPGSHQEVIDDGYDAFLAKFDSSGARVWATYYGGHLYDYAYGITADHNANIYICGYTEGSTYGLATPGSFKDNFVYTGWAEGFLAKFDSNGVRQWGTYYGGDLNDWMNALTTDDSNYVYMTGWTLSGTGISSPGSYQEDMNSPYDGFLVKFAPDGTRVWGTYCGGNNDDYGVSVTVDPNYNIYLTGVSHSTDFASAGSYQTTCTNCPTYADAFLAKYDWAGIRQWATYFGGSGNEYGISVALDTSYNIYIAGYTTSYTDVATACGYDRAWNGQNDDAFLAKFDSSGKRIFGSYYGDNSYDEAYAITVDKQNNLYLAGVTSSTDGIATAGAFQTTIGGGQDAFLSKWLIPVYNLQIKNACFGLENGSAIMTVTGLTDYFTNTWLPMLWDGDSIFNLPPGTYIVTTVEWWINNCWVDDTFEITQAAYPLISQLQSTDASSCTSLDGTASVTTTGGEPPYTYLWSNGDTASGINGLAAGPYSLIVTDASECTYYDTIFVNCAVGINALRDLLSFAVFPNPTSGISYISYTLSSAVSVRIDLYDVLGNKLQQLVNDDQKAGEHSDIFDAGKLTDGVYVLQIHSGDRIASQKIVLLR